MLRFAVLLAVLAVSQSQLLYPQGIQQISLQPQAWQSSAVVGAGPWSPTWQLASTYPISSTIYRAPVIATTSLPTSHYRFNIPGYGFQYQQRQILPVTTYQTYSSAPLTRPYALGYSRPQTLSTLNVIHPVSRGGRALGGSSSGYGSSSSVPATVSATGGSAGYSSSQSGYSQAASGYSQANSGYSTVGQVAVQQPIQHHVVAVQQPVQQQVVAAPVVHSNNVGYSQVVAPQASQQSVSLHGTIQAIQSQQAQLDQQLRTAVHQQNILDQQQQQQQSSSVLIGSTYPQTGYQSGGASYPQTSYGQSGYVVPVVGANSGFVSAVHPYGGSGSYATTGQVGVGYESAPVQTTVYQTVGAGGHQQGYIQPVSTAIATYSEPAPIGQTIALATAPSQQSIQTQVVPQQVVSQQSQQPTILSQGQHQQSLGHHQVSQVTLPGQIGNAGGYSSAAFYEAAPGAVVIPSVPVTGSEPVLVKSVVADQQQQQHQHHVEGHHKQTQSQVQGYQGY